MKNKRIIAGIAAFIILILSLTTPKYISKEEADIENSIKKEFLLPFFNDTLNEVVITNGDSENRIAVIELDGVIAGGQDNTLVGYTGYNHNFFLEQLDNIAEDSTVKGVLFVVNSPGGGVYESAEIRDKLLKIKDNKVPIFVSMKNMAASGGYYVSADADRIYAYEETITGSIGVITSIMNINGLLEKYGIKNYNYTSGEMKDMGSPYEIPSEEEKAIWQAMIDESYDRFVEIIANGRDMDESKVRELADGRIYTASQALNNGLVDKLANTETVLDDLIDFTGIDNPEIFQYDNSSQFNFLYNILGVKSNLPKNELSELRSFIDKYNSSFPSPMYLYGGH